MTFMPRPHHPCLLRRGGRRSCRRRSRKSRSALVTSATIPSSSSPAPSASASQPSQGAAQPGQLRQRDLGQRGHDECALARPAGRQALGLQLAVGLEHRVRVDRQRGDHIPDLGQLVAGPEIPEPQRMLDLMYELQVRRHARGRVEPELDRRSRLSAGRRRADPFIYCHRTRVQPKISLSTGTEGEERGARRDGATERQGQATPRRDGARERQGQATPRRDGARERQGRRRRARRRGEGEARWRRRARRRRGERA